MGREMTESLAGRLLIAAPHMDDPNFRKTVVLICHHDEDGAMGLVINRPHATLKLAMIFEEAGISAEPGIDALPVYLGGPVEPTRGFVLHRAGEHFAATMDVPSGFALSASRDALEAAATGKLAPFLFALGYAGWAPQQLEGELKANVWLVAEASSELVFREAAHRRWDKAIASLGIDPRLLGEGGQA